MSRCSRPSVSVSSPTRSSRRRAQERLQQIKDLGDTTLELTYVGLNHSDESIVMRSPKQMILFAVDFGSVGSRELSGRGT